MVNPLVTIIVPVYKVEKYIRRAIESLIGQSYCNLEIVLVDDGSPDDCPSICDEYGKRDSRVKVIHKQNGGLSDARNFGLDAASGELICFLDSDDYLREDAVGLLVEAMRVNKADIVCFGLNIVDCLGNTVEKKTMGRALGETSKEVVESIFREEFPWNYSGNKIYRRGLFEGNRFPIGRLYEDSATTYKVVARAERIVGIGDCLYFYERGREGNISSELKSKKAAKSYYDGCINCVERMEFCRENKLYSDLQPIVESQFYSWSKLCLEAAIELGKDRYRDYYENIKKLTEQGRIRKRLRMRLIMRLPVLYYYIYPIVRRRK